MHLSERAWSLIVRRRLKNIFYFPNGHARRYHFSFNYIISKSIGNRSQGKIDHYSERNDVGTSVYVTYCDQDACDGFHNDVLARVTCNCLLCCCDRARPENIKSRARHVQ